MTLSTQLKRDEGLRLKPYADTGGAMTIGYGRNLTAKGISLAEADDMLEHDIDDASGEVFAALPWAMALSEPRHAVLVNMAFNMGIHGLLGFRKMLAAVQAGDYTLAATEMLASRWATQVGDRAERLARQMTDGVWV